MNWGLIGHCLTRDSQLPLTGCASSAGIHVCEVDPFTGQMLTPSRRISYGCGGRYPEAPHLYHIGDWYYLMLAEGGTEYGHMVTLQRGSEPYGPFESCPSNPILSHRDFSQSPLDCLGHADMVEDQNGHWWMVALGIRRLDPDSTRVQLHNIDRESFLAPMAWNEDGWPTVGNQGRMELSMSGPLPETPQTPNDGLCETLKNGCWNPAFCHVRNPERQRYHVRNGLILAGSDTSLSLAGGSPTFLGLRQTDFATETTVEMALSEYGGTGEAGVSAFYNEDHHYDLFIERKG